MSIQADTCNVPLLEDVCNVSLLFLFIATFCPLASFLISASFYFEFLHQTKGTLTIPEIK
jgi:hypothetical protein